jgi:prepilin-type N-terminal cleavage/methylation domain-containing protein
MRAPFKKSLSQKEHGFTLIELIIVVVIIAILALVAIPKYYASVGKAQKAQVYANLNRIREAMLSYYAVYGVYASALPIAVTIDGDTVVNVASYTNSNWAYYIASDATSDCPEPTRQGAHKLPGNVCYYGLCMSGKLYGSCTP